jgi:hypothetical protein
MPKVLGELAQRPLEESDVHSPIGPSQILTLKELAERLKVSIND